MILKRADGTRVAIHIYANMDCLDQLIEYSFEVRYCPPGKIQYLEVFDLDRYHKIPIPHRDEYRLKKQLEYVTSEEIYQAKVLFWQLLKPKP
jgi:hypothetical protein